MDEVKIWDNDSVHVVKGDSGVIIALPIQAAHRLALVLAKAQPLPELEGWRDLSSLELALNCLLVGDPASRSLSRRYISTLAKTVKRP